MTQYHCVRFVAILKVEQLEDDNMHFMAISFFFLLGEFYAYWCRHFCILVQRMT